MGPSYVCSRCGKPLIGKKYYKHMGVFLCEECYNRQQDIELKNLYEDIKEIFGLSECPSEVVYIIEKAIKDGKKISGIRGTLKYYYKDKDNPRDIMFLSKVIREQYTNASKAQERQKQIDAENRRKDIHTKINIYEDIPSEEKKEKREKCRMEDF